MKTGKKSYGVGFWLLIVLLTACGMQSGSRQLEKERWKAAQENKLQKTEHFVSQTEPPNKDEQEELLRYLMQTTVQIQGSRYLGSGVIWDESEESLVIATAAHVTVDNDPLTVQFAQGDPVKIGLDYTSDRVDVAFLEVPIEVLSELGISWQIARQDREVCDQLTAGDELLIMGSVEEAADRTYEGRVTEPWIYLEDFGYYMLLGQAYVIPGVSGGGVFTRDGILAGILCGGNDDDQIAVLPWSVMEASWENSS